MFIPRRTLLRTPKLLFSYSTRNKIVGIRREDKNNWERRVALTPTHVKELTDSGLKFIVQPCTKRAFTDEEYIRAGAEIKEDLSLADTIVALKEVPKEKLIPNKTYLFFSHTIKAQPYNMGMLDEVLNKNIRLIDYERILNQKGERCVKFGDYAGYCGTIDSLHVLGERLIEEYGVNTPFVHISYSRNYVDLDHAFESIRKVGEEIKSVGLPKTLLPFTFCVTGDGSVAKATMKVLELLPHKYVTVKEIKEMWKNKSTCIK